MKQLMIEPDCTEFRQPKKDAATIWKLYVDGASRNNPGQAGAGVYLMKNDEVAYQEGFYLGLKTNNQAEYFALLLGLFFAKRLLFPDDLLYIYSDSELLIKQMKGEYRVKKPELKQLHHLGCLLLHGINYSLCHVLRDSNQEADALANKGVDEGGILPADFLALCKTHTISI